ncbi:MAG: hydroxymethylbilane synthase [Acidobacteriota bacterium]|jgi:hydroxymethylbilane synthase|nr:hydroxymethylbilane synthase [Acidobacteriota bacterium]
MKTRLTIGSRGSKLALWQAEWVRARLAELRPQVEVSIEIIKTSGDVLKHEPLAVIGGKGVFTKELEEALLDQRIDLAVHSLKDLPTQLPRELLIAAITQREDTRDALVLRDGLTFAQRPSIKNLPHGSVVGTSSPRRLSQLKHLRSDLIIKDLRGNVDTRLRKLDAGDYDAIILASAGLRRLGLQHRISAPIEIEEMLPAVGQGALGIETRNDEELASLLAPLDHQKTRAACMAERALLRALGGGCQLPIAGHAIVTGERLRLEGMVAGVSGETIIRDSLEGAVSNAEQLGSELATRLLKNGAQSLLAEIE